MKCQVLFSIKNNEKMFKIVVCWSRDWHLKSHNMAIFPSSQSFFKSPKCLRKLKELMWLCRVISVCCAPVCNKVVLTCPGSKFY